MGIPEHGTPLGREWSFAVDDIPARPGPIYSRVSGLGDSQSRSSNAVSISTLRRRFDEESGSRMELRVVDWIGACPSPVDAESRHVRVYFARAEVAEWFKRANSPPLPRKGVRPNSKIVSKRRLQRAGL